MNFPSEPTASPETLHNTLARSRSRYQYAHPNKPFSSPQNPPRLSADQLDRFQEKVVTKSPQEDQVGYQSPEPAFPEQRKEGKDGEAPGDRKAEVVRQQDGYRQDRSKRNDETLQASSQEVKEAEPRRKLVILPEKCPREQQPTLLSKRREEQSTVARATSLSAKSLTQRIPEERSGHRRAQSKEELKRTISAQVTPIVPAFDAPVSAVNAGERRVMVNYRQSVVSISVTPSTTPVDIIRATGELLEPIDPKATVLLESFRQLGLERPLRRYEHVRDILNSWDNDSSNTLVIIPSPTGGRDNDLELTDVASSQPGDTSVYIYHSQKPGHWDKKWVTLRSDGQVLVAKKDGGETSNICHLSDFDIYIPTARQLAKKVKPPRKVCFCVKSQQKSSMFLSVTNFINFFCTNDKALAMAWYKAVQGWRSWYLVNVMGRGTNDPDIPTVGLSTRNARRSDGVSTTGVMASLIRREPSSGVQPAVEPPMPRLPNRSRGAPPISFPRKLTKYAATGETTTHRRRPSIVQRPGPDNGSEPFSSNGLLGRTYTQRQKAQRKAPEDPLALSTYEGKNGLKSGPSQRPEIKPLVDLTPCYQELPQHAKKGKGVVPEVIPPGGLAELATSPEAAIVVPSATTWRRPRTSSGSGNSSNEMQRTKTMGRDRGPSLGMRQASTSPEKGVASISPEGGGRATIGGLLANQNQSQGGTGTGRGIMTGDRTAKAPMLDVGEESQYAPGSLLDRVERHQQLEWVGGATMEREKRRKVSLSVREAI